MLKMILTSKQCLALSILPAAKSKILDMLAVSFVPFSYLFYWFNKQSSNKAIFYKNTEIVFCLCVLSLLSLMLL